MGLGQSQVFSSLRGCSARLRERQRAGCGPDPACASGSQSPSRHSQPAPGLPDPRAWPGWARQKRQLSTITLAWVGGSRVGGRPFVPHSTVTAVWQESIPFPSLRATVLKGRKEPGIFTCPSAMLLPGSVCLCKKGRTGLHLAREQTHVIEAPASTSL